MHVAIFRALAAAGLLAAPPLAAATNLLANPDFELDAAGWQLSIESRVTHAADQGVPAGALRFESDACCTIQAAQCVAVDAGVRYDLGGFFLHGEQHEGQAGDGVGMDLQWFADVACGFHPQLGLHYWTWDQPVGPEWTLRADLDLQAPAGARSALVRIRQYNFAGLPDFVSYADAVFFQRAPGIFSSSFE